VAIWRTAVKAEFHYASWFEAGRRPASNLSAISFEPASVMNLALTALGASAKLLYDIRRTPLVGLPDGRTISVYSQPLIGQLNLLPSAGR